MKNHIFKETIFALSTPYGESALAVIRISGKDSKKVGMILTNKKNFISRKVYYCSFFSRNKSVIDRGLVIFFRSPYSYTGEDMLEIHSHGSVAVIKKLFKELSSLKNCRFAQPGEFSKRGYINGKNDLIHYKGLSSLISSDTEKQRAVSVRQAFGEAQGKCLYWRKIIQNCLASLDASIDFAEEGEAFNVKEVIKDIKKVITNAKKVSELSQNYQNLHDGQKLLIFGPPNSGKSTIYNIICQEDKAIISAIKGTTTDYQSTSIEIFGLKTTVTDSAGVRKAMNIIEKKGITKTLKLINNHQRLILVLSPDSFSKANCSYLKSILKNLNGQKIIVIFNKKDLRNFAECKNKWQEELIDLKKIKSLSISCKENKRNNNILTNIMNFLQKHLISIDTMANEDYYSFEQEQIEIIATMTRNLELCLYNINEIEIASDYLLRALSDLDSLFGKNNIEDRLEVIFRNFCIGK